MNTNKDIKLDYSFSKDVTLYLKGLAIILVIISHFKMKGILNFPFLDVFGHMGVTIFLIASGYGLVQSYRKNQLHGFLNKRLSG